MEILLKKSKITKSILNQTLRSTESDLENSEILGWCIHNTIKYIVLYCKDTKILTKFPLFTDILEDPTISGSKRFTVSLPFHRKYLPMKFSSTSEEEANQFVKLLEKVKQDAEYKGQFFI